MGYRQVSQEWQPDAKSTKILYAGTVLMLTLKAPITTAADNTFCDNFPNFRKR